jgi:CubicO group peptidase (beta-lactamase class C family)
MIMKLYEMGKIGLDDALEKYLPDTLAKHLYNRRSTIADITWREILTHRSGLPAGVNVYKYMKYTDDKNEIGRYDKYYCDMRDDSMYCVEVAKNFFLEYVQLDSLWRAINLTPPGVKEYHYSDINANLFYILGLRVLRQLFPPPPPPRGKMVQPKERWNGSLWEEKLAEWFYKPLQMNRTMYLPLKKFRPEEIAPTAIDREWRKQELRGHVHDPTAAVFGGVAGSAGLFSTAWDQAVLWQMTIFGGSYGGHQFLKPETIEEFTKKQPAGHRGLAFNKPVGEGLYGIPAECSLRTYGHTGYTGNSVWVDPDNEVIYILLSNRSHPKGDNPAIINLGIQGRMHQVVYDAVIDCGR